MTPLDIIETIKKHGFAATLGAFLFVYFQNQINSITEKYEDCMNDRITEAYRIQKSDIYTKSIRWCAVLPESPVGKIKSKENV